MKVGELVNFYTHVFTAANRDYKNPGVIIEVDDSHRQMRYTVMWTGGRITTEYPGYLQRVETED